MKKEFTTSTTNKDLTYTVTEEKYQENLKKGWDDDDMPRPGTYQIGRARHINKKPREKQKVTINIDSDILEFYKKRAAQAGNPPYQTQINNELRRAMEKAEQPENEYVTVAMLENPDFLRALAANIKKINN